MTFTTLLLTAVGLLVCFGAGYWLGDRGGYWKGRRSVLPSDESYVPPGFEEYIDEFNENDHIKRKR